MLYESSDMMLSVVAATNCVICNTLLHDSYTYILTIQLIKLLYHPCKNVKDYINRLVRLVLVLLLGDHITTLTFFYLYKTFLLKSRSDSFLYVYHRKKTNVANVTW